MLVLIVVSIPIFPLFLLYRKEVKYAGLAVLMLTISFMIDQTLFLRTEHIGGAQGLIISVNGIVMLALLYLRHLDVKLNQEKPFHLFGIKSIPFWALMLMALLSTKNAIDPSYTFFELIEFIKMYLILLLIANTVHEKKNRHWLLVFILTGLFLESIIAILQYITGSTLGLKAFGAKAEAEISMIGADTVNRVAGTIGGINELARYFVFLLPISFSLFWSGLSWKLRLSSLTVFFFGCIGLFFTYSRAGWFCFALATGLVLFSKLFSINIKYRVYLFVVFLLIIGVAGSILLGTDNAIRTRFTADDKGSAYVRIPLMKVAMNMIEAHPFVGVGLNNYAEVHLKYDDTAENVTGYFPRPVHNFYLQLAAEIGIPSLIIFAGLILSIYLSGFYLLKNTTGLDQSVILGIMGGMTGFLLHGLVENCSLGQHSLMPLWVFAGWIFGLERSVRLNASTG